MWQSGVNEGEAVLCISQESGMRNLRSKYPNMNEIRSRSWMRSTNTVIRRKTKLLRGASSLFGVLKPRRIARKVYYRFEAFRDDL